MWTFRFEAEVKDFQAAWKLYQRTCTSSARTMKWIRIFATLWLVSIIVVLATSHSINPGFIGLGVAALYILFLLPIQAQRTLKKQFLQIASPGTTLTISIQFDTEEIVFRLQGKSEAKFYWPAVEGIAEDESTFLILPGKRMFYYIPKRALTAEDLDALRSVAPKGTPKC